MSIDLAFRRLRAANPAQPATTVDADALFDRITAVSPEPVVVRSRSRRRVLAVAVALVLAAALATAAPAISNWLGDIIGPSEVQSEYAAAHDRLTLPPGYDWPKLNFPTDSVTSRGAGGAFAVSIAQSAWECYWVDAIRGGDTAGEQLARKALGSLMANNIVVAPSGAPENWSPPQSAGRPIAPFADDGGYEYKERMYAEAAAGRPQLLEQSCRANAPRS